MIKMLESDIEKAQKNTFFKEEEFKTNLKDISDY